MAEAVCEKSRAVAMSASPRYIINTDNNNWSGRSRRRHRRPSRQVVAAAATGGSVVYASVAVVVGGERERRWGRRSAGPTADARTRSVGLG